MILTFLRLIADNPFTRTAAQISGAVILILLAIGMILRRDRKNQRARNAERDHARADRLRDRGRDAAGRELRPDDIIYRD